MDQKSTYRALAISGSVATGTTTLLENLKPALTPLGWTFYSGGSFVREYVATNGFKLEDAESRGDEFTKNLDLEITKRLKEKNKIVVESWLAGFDAQDIPGVFKVLLVCPHEAVIIDRVVNRDKVSVEEAKRHIRARTQNNMVKWKRIYGDHDFWDPKLFDLVIDTYSTGPIETRNMVLNALQNPKS